MKDQLGKAIDRLGSRGQLLVVGIALATVAAVIYLVSSAGGAAYATAFTNLDPKTAGQVQSALAAAGIPTKLVQGGSAVSVPSSKVDQARIAIAKSELPISGSGNQDGWALFDKSSMSETDMQQQVKWQRAMSGEIGRTIESISGIQSATVNLALPKDTVFTEDQRQPTASVLLDTGGGSLPDDTVRGIVRLVAASVPGLTAEHVTVTNERGQLLSLTSSAIGMLGADRLSAEAAWNRRMTSLAQARLDAILGVGNGLATVTGTLNLDQTSQSSQTFQPAVGSIKKSQEGETLTEGQGATGTGAGTPSNLQGTPGTSTTANSSTYKHTKTDSTNALPVTQTQTEVAPGDVKQMNVAVMVTDTAVCAAFGYPKGCPPAPAPAKGTKSSTPAVKVVATVASLAAAKASLTADIQNAVGWSAKRDGAKSFQLASVAALPSTAAQLKQVGVVVGGASGSPLASGPIGMVMGYLKPALAALGLLVMLFFTRRALKRRQSLLSTTDTSWLPALEAPAIRVEDLMPQVEGPSQAELEAIKKKQLQDRVEGIAGDRPQEVAMALRGWLAAGE